MRTEPLFRDHWPAFQDRPSLPQIAANPFDIERHSSVCWPRPKGIMPNAKSDVAEVS